MYRSWTVRLAMAIAGLAFALYILIPTAIYFSLSESQLKEVRLHKNAFQKYLPSWVPSVHIVPGLDLQGGIHMVLGVDTEKAISDKTLRTADRLRDYAHDKKIPFLSLNQDNETSTNINIHFTDSDQRANFEKTALANFGDLVQMSSSSTQLVVALNPQYIQSLRHDAVDQTINTIRTRIDKMGVTEPSIAKRGDDQIQIQLPGYDDATEAKSMIGRTAQLEFQMCNDDTDFLTTLTELPKGVELVKSAYSRPDNSSGKDIFLQFPEDQLDAVKAYLKTRTPDDLAIKFGKHPDKSGAMMLRTYTLDKRVPLTGDDLVDAHTSMGSQQNPRPAVALSFSPTGARLFDELTAKSVGKRMAIVLEENVDSAPVINQRISEGNAEITMGGARTREEMLKDANQLSLVLKSGALPAPVTFREERSVGPSLGQDSVKHGKLAFLLGSLLVMGFMIFYYRLTGFFSILAVSINVFFVLATLSWLGATITLPGIAGLLLTIGMAVDANVIINERIREELRRGKMPRLAIDAGYHAAFSAVIDTHVTTFIAGVVLFQFGTGPVQNFATTLLIGTVWSIVTAVFVTRIFLDMATTKNPAHLSI